VRPFVLRQPAPFRAADGSPDPEEVCVHAEHHIFTLNPHLPFNLMDKLLTAVESVLTDEGAARIWVDPGALSSISVMAELPGKHPADRWSGRTALLEEHSAAST
jgi:hypothetical protein